MEVLDIKDLRELEDLIIDCIYNELLKGQLDQKNKLLHVEHTYGRDVRAEDIEGMLRKLEQWDTQLEQTQRVVEKQIRGCNENVINNYERQLKLELQLNEKRDALLKAISEGKEDQEMGDSGLPLMKKRSSKNDGGRGFLSGFKQGFLNK